MAPECDDLPRRARALRFEANSGIARRVRKSRVPGGVVVGLFCFFSWACALSQNGDTNFREDVILCEEAVQQLEDCCGAFTVAQDACVYQNDYGCGGAHSVLLTESESRCIRAKSCTELAQSGTCDRAKVVLSGTLPDGGVDAGIYEVCQ